MTYGTSHFCIMLYYVVLCCLLWPYIVATAWALAPATPRIHLEAKKIRTLLLLLSVVADNPRRVLGHQ